MSTIKVNNLIPNTGDTVNVNGILITDGVLSATTYLNLPMVEFTGGTISGDTEFFGGIIANTISATTYENLPNFDFTGGTVSGATEFVSGLTADTIFATTYLNLPIDGFTGGTISGDLTITGDLTLTGNLNNNSTGTYKALLTQTGSITGTSINNFNLGLIIGETYTIATYQNDDDFSNIANVLSGNINETGCVFIATGETPNRWFSNSELVSDGNLIVNEVENSLGFPISWIANPMGGYGYYFAFNNNVGPIVNSFPRQKTFVNTQNGGGFFGPYGFNQTTAGIASIADKDDVVFLQVYDFNNNDFIENALYYTPIEINIIKDLDTTPVDVFGTIDNFPFSYASYTISCGDYDLFTNYSDDDTTVNNITELVYLLNNNNNTNQIGVFSADGQGGVKLTIPKNFKEQLCPSSELNFRIFND